MSLLVICFFNDTDATEIYTDGHTLSLHVALLIYPRSPSAAAVDGRGRHGVVVDPDGALFDPVRQPAVNQAGRLHGAVQHLHRPAATRRLRSEEHTSELQSLMRISYAVFCLQNKT